MNDPEPSPPHAAALVLQRRFAAPVPLVYAAWTEPARMKQWFHPGPQWTNPAVEIDLRVGGLYRIEFFNPDLGERLAVAGTFREVVTNQRLVYTWAWEPPKEDALIETLVTARFSERDGETLLDLTHERFASDTMRREHGEGWAGAFACLDASLKPAP